MEVLDRRRARAVDGFDGDSSTHCCVLRHEALQHLAFELYMYSVSGTECDVHSILITTIFPRPQEIDAAPEQSLQQNFASDHCMHDLATPWTNCSFNLACFL